MGAAARDPRQIRHGPRDDRAGSRARKVLTFAPADRRAVAEFLGDTEATVQETYSHTMPDDRERAQKAMERFFARPDTSDRKVSGASDVY
jgi:hypothetical protein